MGLDLLWQVVPLPGVPRKLLADGALAEPDGSRDLGLRLFVFLHSGNDLTVLHAEVANFVGQVWFCRHNSRESAPAAPNNFFGEKSANHQKQSLPHMSSWPAASYIRIWKPDFRRVITAGICIGVAFLVIFTLSRKRASDRGISQANINQVLKQQTSELAGGDALDRRQRELVSNEGRKLRNYVENLKNAEIESTVILGERVWEGVRVVEMLIDCKELKKKIERIQPTDRGPDNADSVNFAAQLDDAKKPFDYEDHQYVFLEISITESQNARTYKYVSFLLRTIEDLLPIEGTNNHFARTPLHEWFSSSDETVWRYDELVRVFAGPS